MTLALSGLGSAQASRGAKAGVGVPETDGTCAIGKES
jgi:hypothetical protein